MQKIITFLLIMGVCVTGNLYSTPPKGNISYGDTLSKKISVLLLGAFHFDNPGLDIAKFKDAGITTPKRQMEIMEVVNNLKKYKPEKVFVEWPVEKQRNLDSLFANYKTDKAPLSTNEIQQIGFRIAKDLNLPSLYAADYRKVNFPFDIMMKVLQQNNQVDMLGGIQSKIVAVQNEFNHRLVTSSIPQIFLWQNSDSMKLGNSGFYMSLLKAGDANNHVGSYLASEWWRRNMFIFENIQKQLTGNESRILVIFGSGHTAVLEQLMKLDLGIEIVDIRKVLGK